MRNFKTNAHRLSELEIARQRCKQRLLVPSDCSQSNHQLSAVNIDWQQDFELCSSEVVQFVVRMYKRAVHHWYWRTPMVTTFGSGGYDTKTPRPDSGIIQLFTGGVFFLSSERSCRAAHCPPHHADAA
eukprot:TRINITY_DN5689_c0_g1_i4.p1 TRINITY_DN5689_c0_g1~~TRINITY_DN5689_c0_g1_i4.p1  ORF type:complete len:128 (-),score=11.91 TRINITY_DN5689_c0_g1_i4:304-687(-)